VAVDEQHSGQAVAPVGDWLVVPGPPFERMWRWGRIVEVLDGDGPLHYRVRWVGDTHDTVVQPPADARVESAADWPEPGSGAFGLWPSIGTEERRR
jgi:Domain of unknown function (DUF1918)